MKKIWTPLILFSLVLGCNATAAKKAPNTIKTSEPFTLVDAYFQCSEEGVRVPVTQDTPMQSIKPGDSIRLFVRYKASESENHPCSVKSEKPCTITVTFESASPDTDEGKKASVVLDDEFRTDGGEEGWSMGTPEFLTRELPVGKGRVLFQITKEDIELFRVEVPIEIK